MSLPRKKPDYPDGRYGLIGGLIFGIGLPCLIYVIEGGIPQGLAVGSGSDLANGMVMYLLPIFAIVGAVVGAFSGELLGLVLFAIVWLRWSRARRS